MDCLACGEPSLLAWQELERSATAFIAIDEEAAVDAVRLLARLGVGSQPSGAAGLGGLLAVADDASLRAALGLGGESRVLLFNTEGGIGPDPLLGAGLVPAAAGLAATKGRFA